MGQSAQVVQTINMEDIKVLFWLLGSVASAVIGGIGVYSWFNRQLTDTRKQIYIRLNQDRELLTHNRERIGLLEQSQNHHSSRLDGMDDKLESMQRDITDTKADIGRLNQKISENHLTLLGAIQQLGDKIEFQKALSHKRET